MDIHGSSMDYLWISLNYLISMDYQWISMDYQWIPMDIIGLSMDIHGLSMDDSIDIHGLIHGISMAYQLIISMHIH